MSYVLNIAATLPEGAPPLASFTIPVRAGLRAAHFLGHGAAVAAMNFGSGAAARIIGAPTCAAGYGEFSGADYLLSDVDEAQNMSFLALVRRPADVSCSFFGNNNSIPGGVGMWSTLGGVTASFRADRDSAATEHANLPTAGTNIGSWQLIACHAPNLGASTILSLTTNLQSTSVATEQRVISGSGKFKIGSAYNGAFTGSCQVALWLAYDRVLTAAETGGLGAWARTCAATLGITA
ncbi:MAG: hypothetical protein LBE86_05390 [Gemmobacter sp.]|jgi:hypothetical protein|nr:hypothetical protein [Gemmobacter sp.]